MTYGEEALTMRKDDPRTQKYIDMKPLEIFDSLIALSIVLSIYVIPTIVAVTKDHKQR